MPSVTEGDPHADLTWTLHWAVLWFGGVSIALVLLMVVLFPNNADRYLLQAVALVVVCLIAILLTRSGHPVAGARWIVIVLWGFLALAGWTSGGLSAPAVTGYLAATALSGLLLGVRAGLATAGISLVSYAVFAYAELAGYLPTPELAHTPLSRAVDLATFTIILAAIQTLMLISLHRSRARTESELAERKAAEQRLEDLVDSAPFGAVTCELTDDDDLILTGTNRPALRILGMDEHSIVGLPTARVFPGFRGTGLHDAIARVAREGGMHEVDFIAYDDGRISGDFEMHAFQTSENHVAVFFRDVSEKRKAADALKKQAEEIRALNAELEDRVRERTIELEIAVAELEEATRAKGEFLASMSHELRTPLNSIIGFAGVLQAGLAGTLNEEQTRQIHMIGASGQRLLGLVNQVLDLSKLEAGDFGPSLEEVDLADVSRHALNVISPIALGKGLELLSEIPDPPVVAVSDRARVDQILLNLLGNAVKFTDVGSVMLTLRSDDESIVLEVADTGPGISQDHLPFVFERFYQIPPEHGGKHEGSGLGLSVSRQLADTLGGEITAHSELGVGSVFTVTLPRL